MSQILEKGKGLFDQAMTTAGDNKGLLTAILAAGGAGALGTGFMAARNRGYDERGQPEGRAKKRSRVLMNALGGGLAAGGATAALGYGMNKVDTAIPKNSPNPIETNVPWFARSGALARNVYLPGVAGMLAHSSAGGKLVGADSSRQFRSDSMDRLVKMLNTHVGGESDKALGTARQFAAEGATKSLREELNNLLAHGGEEWYEGSKNHLSFLKRIDRTAEEASKLSPSLQQHTLSQIDGHPSMWGAAGNEWDADLFKRTAKNDGSFIRKIFNNVAGSGNAQELSRAKELFRNAGVSLNAGIGENLMRGLEGGSNSRIPHYLRTLVGKLSPSNPRMAAATIGAPLAAWWLGQKYLAPDSK